jgi:hypothetical protein
MIVKNVVQQHADDAAALASNRMALVDAPYATLQRLRRFDQRLASNLEGLMLAGEPARVFSDAALETPSAGAVFVVAVRALDDRDEAGLARIFGLVQAVLETDGGLFGVRMGGAPASKAVANPP